MNQATPTRQEIVADDGHRFSVWRIASAGAPRARLVFLSALGTPSRVYLHFARALATRGIESWLPDWRGIDSSSWRAGRTRDFGYRELLEHDLPALFAALPADETPAWVGGHSLGGQLALLTCATRPLAGAVLVASGSVLRSAYSFRFRTGIRVLTALSTVSATMLGYFPGRRLGFGGREARGVMRDWAAVSRSGTYQPVGSAIDYEASLAHLNRPILAMNFAADHWSPLSAARALLHKAPRAPTTIELWNRQRCGGRDLDHYSWARHPDLVAPRISEFILDAR